MFECMIDLETMSSKPNAAIASIGAVIFNSDTLEVVKPFYQNVDLASCRKWDMDFDGDTIYWWMQQSDAARAALKNPDPVNLILALSRFHEFLGGDMPVWGNGATFDNVVLRSAFDAVGMSCPWGFRNDRCYRTLKNLYPGVEYPLKEGVAHNAYDDALWQTNHLFNILKKMREK